MAREGRHSGFWRRATLLAAGVNVAVFALMPVLASFRTPPSVPSKALPFDLIELPRRTRPRLPERTRRSRPRPRPRPSRPRIRPRPRLILPTRPRVRVRRLPRLLRLARIDMAGAIDAAQVDVFLPPPVVTAPAVDESCPVEEPDPVPCPLKVRHVAPAYPHAAFERRIEGYVRARLLIDERGRVSAVKVLKWKGHRAFARAARRALLRWRFQPVRLRGRPMKVWCEQCVTFRLR